MFPALVWLHPHGSRNPPTKRLCTGASPNTHARNRQELYETNKALEQAVKKRPQHGHGKQGKKEQLKAEDHLDGDTLQSNLVQLESGSSKKRHKTGKAKADGEASGSVESPGKFACTAIFASGY